MNKGGKHMKEKANKVVEGLQEVGFKKCDAAVLAFFLCKEEGTAREIEQFCNLRQPEVSMAASVLEEKSFITKRAREEKTTRGRPEFHYKIKQPIPQTIQKPNKSIDVQINKLQSIQDMFNNLE